MGKNKKPKFDEIPDMRKDGSIKEVNISEFADATIQKILSESKQAGLELETKVVGVAVRVVILDSRDKTRTKMATAEIVLNHKDLDVQALEESTDHLNDIDATELNKHKCNGDCDEMPYEAPEKYDGNMYG
jgi:hypothetical protein